MYKARINRPLTAMSTVATLAAVCAGHKFH
jgi:hypothetical protein